MPAATISSRASRVSMRLYTIKQLIALHNGTREQAVMNGVAAPLQRSDMTAVAYYLESLR